MEVVKTYRGYERASRYGQLRPDLPIDEDSMPLSGMSKSMQDEVARLALNSPGMGAIRISQALAELQVQGKIRQAEILPSVRAIGRHLAKVRAMPPEEARRYREALWPESFGTPQLPWEAGAAVIELTRALGRPPLLPLATWYWRIKLALPGFNAQSLRFFATLLALCEGSPAALRATGAAIVAEGVTDAAGRSEILRAIGASPSRESFMSSLEAGPAGLAAWIEQAAESGVVFEEIWDGALTPEERQAKKEESVKSILTALRE